MTTHTLTKAAAAAAVLVSIATVAPALAAPTAFTFRGTDSFLAGGAAGDRPEDLVPSLFAGANVVPVAYPADTLQMDRNTAQAVVNLVAAEQGVEGPIIVAGFSQGAIAVARDKQRVMSLPEAERPAADQLSYVTIGDPTSSGGILRFVPVRVPFLGVGPTRVPETPYDTIVIDREYDGFADFPDRPLNLVATLNALAGIYYVHGRYDEADLDPAHVPATHVTTDVNGLGGRTTRYVVPTAHLPIVQPLRDVELALTRQTGITDGLDAALRPVVDRGYVRNDRPATTRPSTSTDTNVRPLVRDSIKATPGTTSTTPASSTPGGGRAEAVSDADGLATPSAGADKGEADSDGSEAHSDAAA